MDQFQFGQAARPALKRRIAAFGATATSVAALLLATGTAAMAQTDQSNASVETVVVTGFRASIAASLDLKKHSEDIIEAITAEDIGKLPDSSIADSLARLPGLASQRDNNGHWQDISVNGLPPSMTATLFNGRPQASTDNNRVIQFDQYPAELMSAVKVYKTGDAALVNSAIATVDLETIRPLDYDKTTIVVGGQGEYDTRGALQPGASALGGRVNVSYVDQFDNDKLGVMVGFATMSSPNQIYAQHPYGFNQPNDVVSGLQDQVRSDTLARTGVISTVQYRPSSHFQVTVDGFYSFYDDSAIIRGAEIQTACCGNATAVGTPSQGVSSWIVTPQLLNYSYDDRSKQYSLGGTAVYSAGPWSLKADFGFSEADRNNSRIELYSGFGTNGTQNTSTATLTAGAGAQGMIGISSWSLQLANNPAIALGENLSWQQGWWPTSWPNGTVGGNFGAMYGSAYNQHILSNDVIRDTTWSVQRDLGGSIFADIELGVSYSMRTKDYIDHEGIGALNSQNESQPIPSSWLLRPTDLSAFGLPAMFSINPKTAWTSGAYTYLERNDEVVHNWDVREKVLTPYIESRIDAQLMGKALTGNVGVQFVHSDQTVDAAAQSGNWPNYTFTPYSVETQYWDILPSLNLTWQLTDDKQIRLGAGRSMARPRFDSMGGGTTVNYDSTKANSTSLATSPWSGTLANPTLKPWRSDDVDVTYEYYYAPGEAIFVEGFYKNLESFIYDKTTIGDFHPYSSLGTPTPQLWQGAVTEYVNGNGGSLEGVVIGGNFALSHIASVLDGFGVQAQGTMLASSVAIPDPNTSPNKQIPELSKFSGNVSFYYEKSGFSFRINDRYRSSYVQEVPNFDGTLQSIEGASENTVDVQVSYNWHDITWSFAGENLTDTPMNSYLAGNTHHPEYYKLFGTNLLFGMSYKY
ncbi:MAG: TonB-dependent receptor [Alphaproteobacteria bacterium]|nr:TonB-dependent receptor [Alphaproteobacteria bacterium]